VRRHADKEFPVDQSECTFVSILVQILVPFPLKRYDAFTVFYWGQDEPEGLLQFQYIAKKLRIGRSNNEEGLTSTNHLPLRGCMCCRRREGRFKFI